MWLSVPFNQKILCKYKLAICCYSSSSVLSTYCIYQALRGAACIIPFNPHPEERGGVRHLPLWVREEAGHCVSYLESPSWLMAEHGLAAQPVSSEACALLTGTLPCSGRRAQLWVLGITCSVPSFPGRVTERVFVLRPAHEAQGLWRTLTHLRPESLSLCPLSFGLSIVFWE